MENIKKNCITAEHNREYIPYSKTVEMLIDDLCGIGSKIALFIDNGKQFYVFENEDVNYIPVELLDMLVKNFEFLYDPSEKMTRLLLNV